MKTKALKLLLGGAILGGMGYLALTERGRDIRFRASNTAAGNTFTLSKELLQLETPSGITQNEHVGIISKLFLELGMLEASDPEQIEKTRLRLAILADIDSRWRTFSHIFNRGAWNLDIPEGPAKNPAGEVDQKSTALIQQ